MFAPVPPLYQKILFALLAIFCLSPWASPPLALVLGIALAWFAGNLFSGQTQKATHWLLQAAVVGLGFGMDAGSALKAGQEGLLFTIASICGTMIFGYFLGKILKVESKTSYLITSGTAICGGSAIAAVSPVIGAGQKQISVALGVVFVLNSAALVLFPFIGHQLDMTQEQFGLWSAIAIHDTSSVVGASAKYGPQALQIATTVKLARALWIIPISVLSTFIFKTKGATIRVPYFIGLFVIAMLANSYVPALHTVSPYIVSAAKAGLTLTLFFIGCNLSKAALKSVGTRPLLQGLALWFFISAVALGAIMEWV